MRTAPRHVRSRSSVRHRIDRLEGRLLFVAGDLDAAFSDDGRTQLTFPGVPFTVVDSAVAPSGKVVVAGLRGGNVAVARLNVDGTLDTTFGSGGLFESSFRDQLTSVDVENNPDEKVVLGLGHTYDDDGPTGDMQICRLNVNGQGFDSTFGGDGIADVGDRWTGSHVNDVVTLRDGKVLAIGAALVGFFLSDDWIVARYNADGSVDNTFGGGDGVAENGLGSDFEDAFAGAVDYNGTPASNPYYGYISVAGESREGGGNAERFVVLRLTPDGVPHGAFDGDGKLTSPNLSTAGIERATSVTTMPGGKTVVAGYAGNADPNQRNFLVARYNPSGTLDNTFGAGGVYETDLGASRDEALAVTTGYHGGLLVAGARNNNLAIVALTKGGQPDARFSGDGILTTSLPFRATGLDVTGSSITPARRIYVAGGAGHVARLVDVGSTINFENVSAEMREQGSVGTTFRVTRTEALDVAETIFIGTSGSVLVRGASRDLNATNMTFGNGTTTSTNVVIPAGASFVQVTFVPVDDANAEGDEFLTLTVAAATLTYDGGPNRQASFVIRDNDVAAGPSVIASEYLFNSPKPQVRFVFNQNVAASIGDGDFQIIGPSGVPSRTFEYNAATNTATLTFAGPLPDGDFAARAIAATISNAGGQVMLADAYLNFHALAGDANRDRKVNFDDLLILAQNYGLAGRNFGQGNFNYDAGGLVDFDDLLLLAQRYGTSLMLDAPPTFPTSTRRRPPAARDVVG